MSFSIYELIRYCFVLHRTNDDILRYISLCDRDRSKGGSRILIWKRVIVEVPVQWGLDVRRGGAFFNFCVSNCIFWCILGTILRCLIQQGNGRLLASWGPWPLFALNPARMCVWHIACFALWFLICVHTVSNFCRRFRILKVCFVFLLWRSLSMLLINQTFLDGGVSFTDLRQPHAIVCYVYYLLL